MLEGEVVRVVFSLLMMKHTRETSFLVSDPTLEALPVPGAAFREGSLPALGTRGLGRGWGVALRVQPSQGQLLRREANFGKGPHCCDEEGSSLRCHLGDGTWRALGLQCEVLPGDFRTHQQRR